LVEDHQDDARLILHELRRAGFDTSSQRVETEAEFLAHLEPTPELILVDYHLPEFDALRAFHLTRERGLDAPIIVITSIVDDEAAVECLKQGACDYLLKDRLARLGQAVTRALDQTHAREVARRADAARRNADARMSAVFNHVVDGIIISDEYGTITAFNPAAERIFGYTVAEVLGCNINILMPEPHRTAHDGYLANYRRTGQAKIVNIGREVTGRRSDGTTFPIDLAISEFRLDGQRNFAGIVRDITERKRAEERLAHQAKHDSLTGLPNRAQLQETMQRLTTSARSDDAQFALLLLDLDRFKEINDTFGHHEGDAILQQLGPRIGGAVRDIDMIARLGGDEFAILLAGAGDTVAMLITERVLAALRQPLMMQGRPFEVRASIGVALYPEHGQDPGSLLQSADAAMYTAKRSHSECSLYTADPNGIGARQVFLASELREGIARNQLLLHFQPKVDLKTMRPDGAEALVRWQHPREGLIPPDDFIPLAERSGLMKPLSLWVLEAALQQCRAWHQADLMLPVAVNLAPDDLQNEHLVETMVRLLELADVPPAWLTVEVTEGAVMTKPARAKDVLRRLREMGVKVAIDDFGTGYSSLGYLKELPVDEVKVDQTFVKDMAVDQRDARIVRSVIDLGHALGMQVVAEGVEDNTSLDLLTSWGCDFAQGYYVSRPLTAPEIMTWAESA